MRFDDEAPRHIPFTQVWGSNQLSTESAAVRSGIIGKNALLLELPWHGERVVIFRFELAGTSKMYKRTCAERIAREAGERELGG